MPSEQKKKKYQKEIQMGTEAFAKHRKKCEEKPYLMPLKSSHWRHQTSRSYGTPKKKKDKQKQQISKKAKPESNSPVTMQCSSPAKIDTVYIENNREV